MTAVALERRQTEDWSRQSAQRKQNVGQEPQHVVQRPPSAQDTTPAVNPDAAAWAAKNTWFGQNKRMTSIAYTIHDELVTEGIDPAAEPQAYYRKLNSEMRAAFPDHEWGDATPKKKTITSVVAPVNRTSKTTTRVTLNKSQLSVAHRLGLTPEQYAIEVAKLEA
jgi:hypothetical protein